LIDVKALNHELSFSVHYGKDEEDVAVYYLNNIHIHWGKDGEDGSEHAIDGKKYAAEVHLVHTKVGITSDNYFYVDEGRLGKKHDNLFVISVLLEQGERSQNFWPIEDVLYNSPIDAKSEVTMGRDFSMFALISKSLASGEGVYYSYHGSLTGPACDEIVTWAVFRDPLQVSKRQLDTLRNNVIVRHKDNDTNTTGFKYLVSNYRKLQPVNGRNITAYIPQAVMVGGPSGHVHSTSSIPELSFNVYIIMSVLLMLVFASSI